ncbi:MAG: von Willebrand factor type A domain-containing protein, partial [Myxococcota bacterium]|nr:von Willebrand factor type A domain-containing protein [Myxococcota bacterium]
MFRKTLTSLLLGTTLLSTACSKQADKASPAVREQEATGNSNAGSAATQDLPPHPERAAEPIDSVIDRKHVDLAAKPTDSPVTTTPTAVATGYAGLAKGEKDSSGEAYKNYGQNPWTSADKDHLSTFAADVDTASYTIARRKLNEGALPPAAAVRVEEFVNYFDYAFADPTTGTPFSVIMQAAPSPVNPARHILRVGVATKVKAEEARKPANLVFLVDVSGSMQSPDKLELAKKSLRILTQNLKEGDTVALVTYAGSTRVVLKPTGMQHKARILSALEELTAGGSTAMGSGIDLAYQQAMQGLRPGVTSRVIVLSDGDANVGKATHDDILKLISGRVKEGVTLSTIGFGTGNYKDELMEQLANKGNGNNFYIDSIDAAKK